MIVDEGTKLVVKVPAIVMINETDEIGAFVTKLGAVLETKWLAPHSIVHTLMENTDELFQIDRVSGELRLANKLDREIVADVLTVKIRSGAEFDGDAEVGEKVDPVDTSVRIVVRDVNDEKPLFNRKEYVSNVRENVHVGSPLPDVDIIISDADAVSLYLLILLLKYAGY